MNSKILDNNYIITYSNYLKIENKVFSFRRKVLFDITNLPTLLDLKDNGGSKGYWINRKWYSLTKIKNFIKKEEIKVDVSQLQWYQQIQLNEVFNL